MLLALIFLIAVGSIGGGYSLQYLQSLSCERIHFFYNLILASEPNICLLNRPTTFDEREASDKFCHDLCQTIGRRTGTCEPLVRCDCSLETNEDLSKITTTNVCLSNESSRAVSDAYCDYVCEQLGHQNGICEPGIRCGCSLE